jgi:hypothetical protein
MALDYRPGYSRYLEGLSDPFVMAADRRDRRANQATQNRRVDLEERRASLQDLKQQQEFAIIQGDRKKKLVREIKDLAQAGELDEAQAVAAASQYVDPRTGKLASIGFNRGGEERLAPEQLGEAPRLTMPEAPKPFEGPTAGAPPPGMKLQLDPAIAAMQPRSSLPTKKTKPSYTIDGQQFEVDPMEGEEHKRQQASMKAQRYREAAMQETRPEMRMSWIRAAEREEAQMGGAETAQQHRLESQGISQDFQGSQNDLNRQNRIDVKKTRAPGGGGAGGGVKAQTADANLRKKLLDEEQEYAQQTENALRIHGAVNIFKSEQKAQEMAALIAGAENSAALHSMVRGAFVKMAQGGVGVISDQDMKVFWDRMGGLGVRTQQAMYDALNGELTGVRAKDVKDAIDVLIASSKKQEAKLGAVVEESITGLEKLMSARGIAPLEGRVDRMLGMYAPSYRSTRRAKEAKGGNQDAIQQMDAEADEWLKGMGK